MGVEKTYNVKNGLEEKREDPQNRKSGNKKRQWYLRNSMLLKVYCIVDATLLVSNDKILAILFSSFL